MVQGLQDKAQKGLSSLKDRVEALTEEHLNAGQDIRQAKRAQEALIQRLEEKFSNAEAATQESLISLRAKLRALDASRSGEEAKLVQSWMEQSENAEATTQQTLKCQRGEVLDKDIVQAANQCKSVQSGKEAMFQRFKEHSDAIALLRGEQLNRKLAEHLLQDTREVLYYPPTDPPYLYLQLQV
jgi:hypothetical protein